MNLEETAKKAYSAFAQSKHFEDNQVPMLQWEDLELQDKERWINVAAAISPGQALPILSPARCFWEIQAGVIIGQPLPQYNRHIGVTSYEHESSNGDITVMRMVEALEYTRSLHTPERLNWVTFNWLWV